MESQFILIQSQRIILSQYLSNYLKIYKNFAYNLEGF